jgi:hypothetical protein
MEEYIKFNYHNKMIKTLRRGISLIRTTPQFKPASYPIQALSSRPVNYFCSNKSLSASTLAP